MKNRKSRWAKRHCRIASDNRENRDSQIPRKISAFTLVEVTMAIGVIAIGMMGIMALFPVGFQATKRAIGDNYSSELADQFMNLVAMQCKAYEDSDGDGNPEIDGWGEWITNGPRLGGSGFKIGSKLATYAKCGDSETHPNWPGIRANRISKGAVLFPQIGIYDIHPAYPDDANNGMFYFEMKTGGIVDFSGYIFAWVERIPFDMDGNGTIDVNSELYKGNDEGLPIEKAVRLCVEINWPAGVPYAKREKRYYSMDIYNPVPRPITLPVN